MVEGAGNATLVGEATRRRNGPHDRGARSGAEAPPEFAWGPERVERFEHEVRAAAKLTHANTRSGGSGLPDTYRERAGLRVGASRTAMAEGGMAMRIGSMPKLFAAARRRTPAVLTFLWLAAWACVLSAQTQSWRDLLEAARSGQTEDRDGAVAASAAEGAEAEGSRPPAEQTGAPGGLGGRSAAGRGVPPGRGDAAPWSRLAGQDPAARRYVDRLIAEGGIAGWVRSGEGTERRPAAARPAGDAVRPAAAARWTVAPLGDADCMEVASVDYSDWSGALENNRMRHVFQHVEDYPYYRRVEDVFVGLETSRWFPDGTTPGWAYWTFVDGRQGVGAEGHYSLIEDFRGDATVRGVSVGVNVNDDFAFFLYDREQDRGPSYYAHVATEGRLGVMTTIGDGAEFIDVHRSLWRRGGPAVLRLWSKRFSYYEDHAGRYHDWNDAILREKPFRTLFFLRSPVRVAGVEREVNRICRLAYSPLVVTNSDDLLPAVEEELTRRAARIHAVRIVNGQVPATREDRRASFRMLAPDTFVRVATVPTGHAGDFRRRHDLFGDVAVTFTRDPLSDQIHYRTNTRMIGGVEVPTGLFAFFVEGRLEVGGRDVDGVVDAFLGSYRRCCSADNERLARQTFDVRWRDREGEDFRVACASGECSISVRKRRLELDGARPDSASADAGAGRAGAANGPSGAGRAAAGLAVPSGAERAGSAADDDGWTDLHYAAVLNLPREVARLLRAGARVDARLRDDRVPLGSALKSALRLRGRDLAGWTRDGETPLHLAAWADAGEAVERLVAGGAALDARTSRHWTPLHYAAAGGASEAMRALIASGADPRARNSDGETPDDVLRRLR